VSSLPPRPLYKYLSPNAGIKNVLEQGTLKWALPAELNDPFDNDLDVPLEKITDSVVDEFTNSFINVNDFPFEILIGEQKISGAQFAQMLKELEPQLTPEDREQLREAAVEGLSTLERNWPTHLNELRAVFQGSALFCMSERYDDMLMWSHYADKHQGLVIAFSPNNPDSPFSLAKPVRYVSEMPKINIGNYVGLSNNDAVRDFGDLYMLTKSDIWSYEREWRVVVAGGSGIRPFHEEDIAAIYLGCRMSEDNKKRVAAAVKQKYPAAKLYVALKASEFKLDFREYN